MKKNFFLLSLLLLVSIPRPARANVGEYRGYIAAQNLIGERLMAAPFTFNRYFGTQYGLLNLMGFYDANGENSFRNGKPNAINTLVWQMALQAFSADLAGQCEGRSKLILQPVFQSTLTTICQWPAPQAQDEAAMRMLWLSVMAYDAPEEEFLAWREFFLHSNYASRPASEAVPALIFSILYNPHFLLRK